MLLAPVRTTASRLASGGGMEGSEVIQPGRLAFVHSVRDLLREIHERPAVWLGKKTLTGLECLLLGYEMACIKHGIAETERLPDDVPWRGFSDWVAKRYDKVGWSVGWHWLLVEHSRSEEEAFDRFFDLLAEYEAGA